MPTRPLFDIHAMGYPRRLLRTPDDKAPRVLMTTLDDSASPFHKPLVTHPGLQMALCTFAILVIELALIRWVGTQIRVAAYFANLVLIAAFLGMGLGVALGRRKPQLFGWALTWLALLSVLLGFATDLGLTQITFPDPAISLWGGENSQKASNFGFLIASGAMVVFFWALAAVFVLAGIPVGWLFARMNPLVAYRWDLLGSVLGVATMAIIAWAGATPPVWFALGIVPILLVMPHPRNFVAAVVILGMSWYSVHHAIFSPYNRIDVDQVAEGFTEPAELKTQRLPEYEVSVNRDFHQYMLDLRLLPDELGKPLSNRGQVRMIYEIPFRASPLQGSALVVGAGTGNDVAAALRVGFDTVTSVDIDPRIIKLGEAFHPEKPYANPGVERVVNDARAYFVQTPDKKFDVVCYGLLDSHAMFSAMSSLRLDNFVYTVEGIRAGWQHVAEGGVMSVSFSIVAGDWMAQRMNNMIFQATGLRPIIVPHGYNYGATFLVGKTLTPEMVRAAYPRVVDNLRPDESIRAPTDDWPFLYLRPGTIPFAYLSVMLLVALTATVALRRAFGAKTLSVAGLDWQMFLLGAGFMLIETRMVTELSLLFGSTWIVNTSVFGGILCMVLLANEAASRWKPEKLDAWYGLLFLALIAVTFLGVGMLNQLAVGTRIFAAGLLVAVPVFFAGIIFSSSLRRAPSADAALGANLCGAMVGGLLEYLSMAVGLRAIGLLALVIYLLSFLVLRQRDASGGAPAASAG